MGTFTITYPDLDEPEILESFDIVYNYQTEVDVANPDPGPPMNPPDMQPNPETPAQHAKRRIVEFMKQVHRDGQMRKLRAEAEATIEPPDEIDFT